MGFLTKKSAAERELTDTGGSIDTGRGHGDCIEEVGQAESLLLQRGLVTVEELVSRTEVDRYRILDLLDEEGVAALEERFDLPVGLVFPIVERRHLAEKKDIANNRRKRGKAGIPNGLFEAVYEILQRRLPAVEMVSQTRLRAYLNQHHSDGVDGECDRATLVLKALLKGAFNAELNRVNISERLACVERDRELCGNNRYDVKGFAAVLEGFRHIVSMFECIRACGEGLLLTGDVQDFVDQISSGFGQIESVLDRMAIADLLIRGGLRASEMGGRRTWDRSESRDLVKEYLYSQLEGLSAEACDEYLESHFKEKPPHEKIKTLETLGKRARPINVLREVFQGRLYELEIFMVDGVHLRKVYDQMISDRNAAAEELLTRDVVDKKVSGFREKLLGSWRSVVESFASR